MRYFFHLRNQDGSIVADRSGVQVDDPTGLAAIIQAAITELGQESRVLNAPWREWTLEIVNDRGEVAAEYKLADFI